MFGRKKQTGRRSTPLSKEEEERLLGRITSQDDDELRLDPVFGSSLQKKRIREIYLQRKKEIEKARRRTLTPAEEKKLIQRLLETDEKQSNPLLRKKTTYGPSLKKTTYGASRDMTPKPQKSFFDFDDDEDNDDDDDDDDEDDFKQSMSEEDIRKNIKSKLDKLSNTFLKDLAEDRKQGSAKDKQRNLEIMTEYFYNDPDEWQEFKRANLGMQIEEIQEIKETKEEKEKREDEEREKYIRKQQRGKTPIKKQISSEEIESFYNNYKKDDKYNDGYDDDDFGDFVGYQDNRYNDGYDDDDFGDFVGYQDNTDLIDINEDVEAKGREEVKIKNDRLTAEAPRFNNNLDEFINSVKEDYSNTDLLNTNQNVPGINEMKTRQRQQDKTNEQKYIVERENIKNNPEPNFIEQLESKYDNIQPTASEIGRFDNVIDDRRNPIYNSSMPDNSNYEISRENAFNNIVDLMEENGFVDRNYLEDIHELPLESLNNIYISMLGREREHKSNFGGEVKINNPNPIAQNISSVVSHNIPEGSAIDRLRNLGESSIGRAGIQAGLQAGEIGYQRGGVRGAIRGGAEGLARGGVAQAIADNLGGGLIGQIGQRVGQEGISQISDIMSRLIGSDVPQDESEQLVQQINKINEHLERLDEPTKYPEMREIQRITFPDEKIKDNRNNVKLVQNAITQFINDKNLYGESTYEESNDILLDI